MKQNIILLVITPQSSPNYMTTMTHINPQQNTYCEDVIVFTYKRLDTLILNIILNQCILPHC